MFPAAPILALSMSTALLDVLVVQPNGPAGTYPDIQSACNQTHERDVILVKSGLYPAFEVLDKWLTIAADTGASVTVDGGIRVHDLSSAKKVTLIGLHSSGTHFGTSPNPYALELASDQGSVRVEGCTFQGVNGVLLGDKSGWAGVRIANCPDVELSHCTSTGGTGQAGDSIIGPAPGTGGPGMTVQASNVTLYDCTIHGGFGSSGVSQTNPDGGNGGTGCPCSTSTLFASRTSFIGGSGGSGFTWCESFTVGGVGGNGLQVAPGPARLLSTTEAGGAGGFSQGLNCFSFTPEAPGVPRVGPPSAFVDLAVVGRSMTVGQNPVREGTALAITAVGQPGDRVGFVFSPFTSSAFNAAWNGQQLFPEGPALLRFGTIPAGGSLVQHLPIADLGPGIAGRPFQLQAVFAGTDGHRVLGTPISLLVLDSAY